MPSLSLMKEDIDMKDLILEPVYFAVPGDSGRADHVEKDGIIRCRKSDDSIFIVDLFTTERVFLSVGLTQDGLSQLINSLNAVLMDGVTQQ